MAKVANPAIPVRQNRTVRLRRIFQVCNDDLSYLVKPPQSEASPTIIGQNKSVAKTMEKQVTTWFREQYYFMERLNKSQVDAYHTYLRIQKERMEVYKETMDRHAAFPKSASTFAHSMSKPPTGINHRQHTNDLLEAVSRAGEKAPKGTHPLIAIPRHQTCHLPDIGSPSKENDDNGRAKTVPSNPLSQSLNDFQERREVDARSARSLAESPESRPSLGPRHVTVGPVDTSRTWPGLGKKNAKERQRAILNQPVTPWSRTKSGSIVQAEGVYKRKKWPVPQDPAILEEKKVKMIAKEKEKREMHLSKYATLINNIDDLEKWDPLKEIQARMPKKVVPKQEIDEYKNLGALGVFAKAYKSDDEYIKSLDPNSQEALEMCKYLRNYGEDIPQELQDLATMLKDDENDKPPTPKPKSALKDKSKTDRKNKKSKWISAKKVRDLMPLLENESTKIDRSILTSAQKGRLRRFIEEDVKRVKSEKTVVIKESPSPTKLPSMKP